MRYKVFWKKKAKESLKEISDWTAEKIRNKVENHLTKDPYNKGKPLTGKQKGFWRMRFQDYWVIYQVQENKILI